jgi:hypothetical protein
MADDEPVRIPLEDSIDLHAFHPRDVVSSTSTQRTRPGWTWYA